MRMGEGAMRVIAPRLFLKGAQKVKSLPPKTAVDLLLT